MRWTSPSNYTPVETPSITAAIFKSKLNFVFPLLHLRKLKPIDALYPQKNRFLVFIITVGEIII